MGREIMKIINVFFLCLFLSGCVTAASVKKELDAVDYSDGANQREALIIARMAMINSKLHGDYQLWAATIHDNGAGYWRVVFMSLYFDRHECVLIIEKKGGDILAFYEASDDEEAVLGTNPVYSIEGWRRLQKFD